MQFRLSDIHIILVIRVPPMDVRVPRSIEFVPGRLKCNDLSVTAV